MLYILITSKFRGGGVSAVANDHDMFIVFCSRHSLFLCNCYTDKLYKFNRYTEIKAGD